MKIGIGASPLSAGQEATFGALADVFDIRFEFRAFGDDTDIDAWILLAPGRDLIAQLHRTKRPCYVVPNDEDLISLGTSSRIAFGTHAELDEVFHGREVSVHDAVDAKGLPGWLTDVVPVSRKEGSPWWAIRETANVRHYLVGLPPPPLAEGEPLFVRFCGDRFAALLPLWSFLRSLTDDSQWEPPPLQAAFMFDDPNLHWRSYGFIDYAELVRHAARSNYHVSFATIPLDAWFAHPTPSGMFRQNADRISLLFHGNDHVSNELGPAQPSASLQRLLAQALGRIARLEARAKLEVSRVMAPPHGACSESAIAEMARAGFEAVCVSRGSLFFHNRSAAWTRTIGMKPCDVIHGLPVIPRFGLSATCGNDVLIAALLRQPIVPITHHQAVEAGFDLLREIASVVNSLGKVTWSDMRTISRSLYSRRQEEDTLRVRMWSRRVRIAVPERTKRLEVERPWLREGSDDTLLWRSASGAQRWNVASPSNEIPVEAGTTLEVASGRAVTLEHTSAVTGSYRLAAVARRVLTEGRDRALPGVQRIARSARLNRTAKYSVAKPDSATRP